jgi:hypothetical protein
LLFLQVVLVLPLPPYCDLRRRLYVLALL